jgi:hypothetical protein
MKMLAKSLDFDRFGRDILKCRGGTNNFAPYPVFTLATT